MIFTLLSRTKILLEGWLFAIWQGVKEYQKLWLIRRDLKSPNLSTRAFLRLEMLLILYLQILMSMFLIDQVNLQEFFKALSTEIPWLFWWPQSRQIKTMLEKVFPLFDFQKDVSRYFWLPSQTRIISQLLIFKFKN